MQPRLLTYFSHHFSVFANVTFLTGLSRGVRDGEREEVDSLELDQVSRARGGLVAGPENPLADVWRSEAQAYR